ncbi:MAG: nuclear transport factor 2 family protein [Candidatus Acidiferrum sp.]
MKRAWILCVLGFFYTGSAAWSQTKPPDHQPGPDAKTREKEKAVAQISGVEKTITGLENQWLESQKTNNPDLVAPLLADKFVNTSTEGKVTNRAETLATAKATKYTSAEYEDVKVTVFGDVAIATGGFKAKGTDPSGKPFDTHERWTDTWVKLRNGQWLCVATQGSPVK